MKRRGFLTKSVATALALTMCLMGPAAQAADVAQGLQEEYATPGDAEVYDFAEEVSDANIDDAFSEAGTEEVATEVVEEETADLATATDDVEEVDEEEILAGTSFEDAILLEDGRITVDLKDGENLYYKYIPSADGVLFATDVSGAFEDWYDENHNCIYGCYAKYEYGYLLQVIKGKTYYICLKAYSDNSAILDVENTTASGNGWKKVHGRWFFYENGKSVTEEWRKLGKYWYYFDGNGAAADSTSVHIYDKNTGYHYYSFDKDCRLIVGWKQIDEDWLYSDANGYAADGITTIGDDTYYFQYGRMLKDVTIPDNDKTMFYYFGEDGKLVKTAPVKDGWVQFGKNWRYWENGAYIKNTSKKIGDDTYYFEYDGNMATNCFQNVKDPDTGETLKRYFGANGKMATGWTFYDDYYWCYYDEDSNLVTGKQVIDGKLYYFDSNGRLCRNYELKEGLTWRYFGQDGAMDEEITFVEGWNTYRGEKYYLQDGSLIQGKRNVLIDGYYYGFDGNGVMLHDITSGEYVYDSDGHSKTGWFQSSGQWYYIDSTGIARGEREIGGKKYYFQTYYTPYMVTDRIITYFLNVYYYGPTGELEDQLSFGGGLKGGWNKFYGKWLYFDNEKHEIYRRELKEINGKTYYFDDDGFMVTGLYQVDHRYRFFDENGCMATSGWRQSAEGKYYYFDQDGYVVKNMQTIDGKQYFFSNSYGYMYVDCEFKYNNKWYRADKNGYVEEIPSNSWLQDDTQYLVNGARVKGWNKIDGNWYYFDFDTYKKVTGQQTIDGAKYHFDYYGRLKTGWIATNDGWSYADSNGVLFENGWKTIDNKKYYFKNGHPVSGMYYLDGGSRLNFFDSDCAWVQEITGEPRWIKLDGDYYYYKGYGKYARNGVEKIDGKEYYFDERGKNVSAESADLTILNCRPDIVDRIDYTWKKDALGRWEYYGKNGTSDGYGRYYDRWAQINGKWYYFDNRAYMVTGDFIVDGRIYHFNENGVWDGTSKTTGWAQIEGGWYYLKNGVYASGRQTIGGQTYYFEEGRMMYDAVMYDGTVVGKDGKIVKNGWYKLSGCYYVYADANGRAATGLRTIGGKQYYFKNTADQDLYRPLMCEHNVLSDGRRTLYEIGSNGVVSKIVDATKNGWYKAANGDWYYVCNGVFVEGYQKISGVGYYFENGAMVKNKVVDGYGYFDSEGALTTTSGWKKVNGNWQYLRGGKCVQGVLVENGKEYYLTPDNYIGAVCIDGVYYIYDGNGGKKVVGSKEGWIKAGADWYYFYSNRPVDGFQKIDGVVYCFENGRMLTNCKREWEITWDRGDHKSEKRFTYLGADGKLVKNTWFKIDGVYYYADANGYLATGEQKIDGVKYYFSAEGAYLGK